MQGKQDEDYLIFDDEVEVKTNENNSKTENVKAGYV
jgi:hypothetical protein